MSKLDRIVGYVAVVCFFGAGACFIFAGCGMLWNALFGEDQAIRNAHRRDAFGLSIGNLEKHMVARQDGSYAPARGFGDELKTAVTNRYSAAGKDGPGGNGNLNGIDFHAADYTKSL